MACPFVMMELDGLRKSNGDVGTGLFNSLACAAKLRPTATILRQREANTLAEEAMAEEGEALRRQTTDTEKVRSDMVAHWFHCQRACQARLCAGLIPAPRMRIATDLNFSSSPQRSFTV
jgi:hypothetical protein